MVEYLSEEEQAEALRAWWRENWKEFLAGIVLCLAGIGAWKYWGIHQDRRAHDALGIYTQFESAYEASDMEKAASFLATLADEHPSLGYTQQARLKMAKARVEAGKLDEALDLLRQAARDSDDDQLVQVANLRIARLLIEQGKYDEALQLAKLDDESGFAAQAREIRGDALLAKGDTEGARAEYAAALAAIDGPQFDRTLLELKLGELGGGAGGADKAAEGSGEADETAVSTRGEP
ncbi:MAG TPA: tetratricopeptide repeat protein [Steroidobacter sp.]